MFPHPNEAGLTVYLVSDKYRIRDGLEGIVHVCLPNVLYQKFYNTEVLRIIIANKQCVKVKGIDAKSKNTLLKVVSFIVKFCTVQEVMF